MARDPSPAVDPSEMTPSSVILIHPELKQNKKGKTYKCIEKYILLHVNTLQFLSGHKEPSVKPGIHEEDSEIDEKLIVTLNLM